MSTVALAESGLTAHAFWVVEPGRGELRAESLPALKSGEILVRTMYSAISRGTEALVFRGEVPHSQYLAMRAPFQQGDFPAPVKYGYCSVGLVEDGVHDLCGQTVFCLYPHQDRYVVPAAAVMPVPRHIPPGRAVLAANLETALNALWDAVPRLGDRITVIGAGVVGCLIAWLAGRLPGCCVQLVDVDPTKAAVAEQLGVQFATPTEAKADQDLVIHASGAADGLVLALRMAGFEATVLEVSWFGARPVSLPLGEAFHAKRLRIQSSQVGTIAPTQRARWDHRRRMATVMALLVDPVLDCLISGESLLTELPRVLSELSANPPGVLCHRIRYNG